MAKYCTNCNKKLPFSGGIVIRNHELCDECYEIKSAEIIRENSANREREEKLLSELKLNSNLILLTSLFNIENKKITQYFDLISTEIFMGTGFLSEISTSVDDIFGTKSDAFSEKMDKAKKIAIEAIKIKTVKLGANAILGAKIEYLINKNNLIMYSVSGTPVILEDI